MIYIVLCSKSQIDPEVAYITINAFKASKREVHEFAAKEFRHKFHLAPNIHVQTVTLHECETSEAAELFVQKLEEAMKKVKQ